jgi:hypothetical protein
MSSSQQDGDKPSHAAEVAGAMAKQAFSKGTFGAGAMMGAPLGPIGMVIGGAIGFLFSCWICETIADSVSQKS